MSDNMVAGQIVRLKAELLGERERLIDMQRDVMMMRGEKMYVVERDMAVSEIKIDGLEEEYRLLRERMCECFREELWYQMVAPYYWQCSIGEDECPF